MELEERLKLLDTNSLLVDIKEGYASTKKAVTALSQQCGVRAQQEAERQQQRQQEQAVLDAEIAVEGAQDPALQEQDINEMKRKVDEALQKGADAVGPEPPLFMQVVQPVQALPALDCASLAVVQQLSASHNQLLGTSSSSDSGSLDQAAAEEMLAWLLHNGDLLAMCPDEATAQLVFWTISYGPVELARAAYCRFLAWCGMWECETGEEVPQFWQQLDLASTAGGSSSSTGILLSADQRPPVTAQWLPNAANFLTALRTMGCSNSSSSADSSSSTTKQQGLVSDAANSASTLAQQQQATDSIRCDLQYRDANMRWLLQLLTHFCRLGTPQEFTGGVPCLPVNLGDSASIKQLALLLLRLQLDKRVLLECRGQVMAALAALLSALNDKEWGKLLLQLVEAIALGLGPSHRSSVALLCDLPRTDRCTVLQQQAAKLLLSKLLPGKQVAQTTPTRGSRTALLAPQPHELHDLLQAAGVLEPRHLIKGLLFKQEDGKETIDQWRLLTILDAADAMLWSSLTSSGASLDEQTIKWFCKDWLEKLEQQLSKKRVLSGHRVRSRVTELRNMYEFTASMPSLNDNVQVGSLTADDDGF